MAATADCRFNPGTAEFHGRYTGKGKNRQNAMTAAMRRLIVTANPLHRGRRAWENHAGAAAS